jgi:inosose dehydratase
MTRRDLLLATAALPALAAPSGSARLSVEGYIFQQYAELQKKPLREVLPQVLRMAHDAGFQDIELNTNFFAPDTRAGTLGLLRSNGLSMPSVYVGGAMHERSLANATISRAIEIADICAPFGCRAVVNNPDPKPQSVEKTDSELATQAESLNRMAHILRQRGFELRIHHHTPQLVNHAREWKHILEHTDSNSVFICVDVDWAYEGGFEPVPFLREVGNRLREIHVRSAINKVWMESLQDSDIDYRAVAAYLKEQRLRPLVVVELAYRPTTVVTRPLAEDLLLSHSYAARVFGLTG